ncbi:LexA family transcriptional regulator [Sinorhizobium medicae]|uniref:LexA family transcriptional regulator n=1 Tax=Sinorhizobium medicae TaxID=110321 RepID=UPI001AAE295F|nr:LexA family transcriptional regulator [Sinorhizobium medicae]MBO1959469.1 LexA family transcriptional regulator [Sinorhizobium medicae]WQP37588.1 LexA family transcriptional regulator [Sinorhizobium medicae]
MTLGEQISAARRAKKLRQHIVAEELGVTVQAVSQWERDKTVPSPMNLMRLSRLLGVKFDGLEILKHIPMFAKPATYAPLLGPFTTLFYGPGKQDDDPPYFDDFGDFIAFEDPKTEMIPISWDPIGNVFAMRIEDRSMAPNFLPGDIIIVDAGIKPEPGNFVVGQAYPTKGGVFRKYRLKGTDADGKEVVDLVPLNSDFPTTTITVTSTGEITGCLREHRRFFGEK